MKIIIAGGREYADYDNVKKVCDHMLQNQEDIEIVSGKADGADYLGEQYAKEKGYKVTEFPADWDKHKNAAGPIRNGQMADYADALIAFWDGKSRGTANMIKQATKKGLKVKVSNYGN